MTDLVRRERLIGLIGVIEATITSIKVDVADESQVGRRQVHSELVRLRAEKISELREANARIKAARKVASGRGPERSLSEAFMSLAERMLPSKMYSDLEKEARKSLDNINIE